MPKTEPYAQGTPCWVDLSTSDIGAARSFYTALFGWELEGMPAGDMTYYMARLRGEWVAGLMERTPRAEGQAVRSYWATYLAVDDADEAARRAVEAGGQIIVGPDDVPGGRVFVAQDPSGAQIGFWQDKGHAGVGLVNEPGTLGWAELQTRNVAAALPFYEAVASMKATTRAGDRDRYTEFVVDGQTVAGAMTTPMPGLPPYWMVYFAVEDVDAALERVRELGGLVHAPAFTVPGVGRIAVAADPTGAPFSLLSTVPKEQG